MNLAGVIGRRSLRGEDGRITLLMLALSALVFTLVVLGVVATSLHLQRGRVQALADSAALLVADNSASAVYYDSAVNPGNPPAIPPGVGNREGEAGRHPTGSSAGPARTLDVQAQVAAVQQFFNDAYAPSAGGGGAGNPPPAVERVWSSADTVFLRVRASLSIPLVSHWFGPSVEVAVESSATRK